MFLFFQVISPMGDLHKHTIACFNLEFLFTMLNDFVACNFRLVSAYLVDEEGGRTNLSVEAFDGTDATRCLEKLEREYRQVLSVQRSR